ncbi:hypothetical protein [Streptantibioticus silvisoli]|uniref:WXG100 family type VII secretion target n=1 Tax=Streptantibioticus silvisoli TaxID=2705255 RepID=A0ABT6W2V3_9ACTN|nr:hypothetical protein [Streptantibioticus silvisoli]MDI5965069.1 hypothetical protein [Streptantibioticus silvisoli]
MADLRVDDGLLADCELRLSRLHREFRDLDARRVDLAGLLGSREVADAMDGFFDNWTHYRAKLLTALETVGTQVAQTRTTFRHVDERLAGAPHR